MKALVPRLLVAPRPDVLQTLRAAAASRAPSDARTRRSRSIARRVPVGQGTAAFGALAEAIAGWQLHRAAGIVVATAGDGRPTTGSDVALAARTGPLWVAMCCRVVDVEDTATRRGLTYATLPGHPESGRESLTAEIDDAGLVSFTVQGYTRPGTMLTTLAAPVARLLAERTITRYCAAARTIASTR